MAELPPAAAAELRRRLSWRPLLRALHRDAGYLAVGLTLVYALSGLAVNHIKDWDPNFKGFAAEHQLEAPLPADEQAAAALVLERLGIAATPRDVYLAAPGQLEIELDQRSLHVDLETGHVTDEGQRPRFLLRAANWLHLNRGKRAWTYIADGYAVFLVFLAVSGMFMLRGRRGLIGRGGLLVMAGAAVPIVYVTLSGGP